MGIEHVQRVFCEHSPYIRRGSRRTFTKCSSYSRQKLICICELVVAINSLNIRKAFAERINRKLICKWNANARSGGGGGGLANVAEYENNQIIYFFVIIFNTTLQSIAQTIIS